ncbi:hypothetical protein LDENG_00185560 [Lucifuga dentata]|nr:hypothetical protein LDENG_00185560 [Lucifuga dentata]
MRQKLNSLSRTPSTMSGEHQALLITWLIPSYSEAWWCSIMLWLLLSGRDRETGQS